MTTPKPQPPDPKDTPTYRTLIEQPKIGDPVPAAPQAPEITVIGRIEGQYAIVIPGGKEAKMITPRLFNQLQELGFKVIDEPRAYRF